MVGRASWGGRASAVVALVALVVALVPGPAFAAAPSGGDGCADAARVTGDGTASGSTAGMADDHGNQLGANVDGEFAPDVVWTFDIVERTRVVISSAGVAPWLGGLYLMYGPDHPSTTPGGDCSGGHRTIQWDDNWFKSQGGSPSGDYSLVIEETLDPGPYYVWLDGDNSRTTADSGPYEVSFEFLDAQPGGGGSTPGGSPGGEAVYAPGTDRRLGSSSDAVTAAVELSRGSFRSHSAPYAVLGRDDVFADSLAGAALAGTSAPILYTTGGADAGLRPETLAEIERVVPPATQCQSEADVNVYVLGGQGAISAAASRALAEAGYCVGRFAGASRVETALQIASFVAEREGGPSQVLIARADNWADAATGGAYAAASGVPVLVTDSASLHPSVGQFLTAIGRVDIVLLGGAGALSERVAADAARFGDVRRVAGASRDGTAAAIATQLWAPLQPTGVILLNGWDALGWAYALAGSVTAAIEGAVQLYVQPDSLPPATAAYLDAAPPAFVVAAGPPALVSDEVWHHASSGGASPPSPGPSPTPSAPPSTPGCAESAVRYDDTDDDPYGATQSLEAVTVSVVANAGDCRVDIAQDWHGIVGDGRPYISTAAFYLDTDGDASNGCAGGEVMVLFVEDGTYWVLDTPSCEQADWTDSDAPVEGQLREQGAVISFPVDAFGADVRFTTDVADDRNLWDAAPDDSVGEPQQTAVFG